MNFSIILTTHQLSVISQGLISVPYGQAAPVINDINQQIQAAQTQAKFDAAVDARDMPSGQTMPPDLFQGD